MDISFILIGAIGGVPILLLVFMLVQWVKSFKTADGLQLVDGNKLLVISGAIGCMLGVIYIMYTIRPPFGVEAWDIFKYWAGAAAYGIALGGLASLFFDAVKAIVTKSVETFAKRGVDQSGQD